MYKATLIQGETYTIRGVQFRKGITRTVTEEVYNVIKDQERFEVQVPEQDVPEMPEIPEIPEIEEIEEIEELEEEEDEEEDSFDYDLETLSKDELYELAKDEGLKVTRRTTKPDLLKLLLDEEE